MHVLLLKFYKIWTNKTIFDMAITTSVIINYYIAISYNLVLPSP